MGNFAGQGPSLEAKPPKLDDDDNTKPESSVSHGLGNLYFPGYRVLKKKASACHTCLKILFVILSFIVLLLSVAVIGVSVTTAFATKIYSSDMSGRLVAMIILAVTAAIALSIAMYAVIAVFRNQVKPVHAASVVLVILVVIQILIAVVSIRVGPEDEGNLGRSLTESFKLAREDSPRHVKIWATTQHDLNCCGLFSPEDYRHRNLPNIFPPDVPISCCPSYDPDRSELVQERDREMCKAKREFNTFGCKDVVIEVFRETATLVLSVTITLIVVELLLSIVGAVLSKEKEMKSAKNPEDGADDKKSVCKVKS